MRPLALYANEAAFASTTSLLTREAFHDVGDVNDTGNSGDRGAPADPSHADTSPDWPYDIEPPHDSPQALAVIDWFLQQKPQLRHADVMALLALIRRHVGERPTTVSVDLDPELGDLTLWLLTYGFAPEDWPSKESIAVDAELDRLPHLAALWPDVSFAFEPDSFRLR
jgi:hypothetical protein